MDWKWQVSIDHDWMDKVVIRLGMTKLNKGTKPLSHLLLITLT